MRSLLSSIWEGIKDGQRESFYRFLIDSFGVWGEGIVEHLRERRAEKGLVDGEE